MTCQDEMLKYANQIIHQKGINEYSLNEIVNYITRGATKNESPFQLISGAEVVQLG